MTRGQSPAPKHRWVWPSFPQGLGQKFVWVAAPFMIGYEDGETTGKAVIVRRPAYPA
jgi:hypothetical protein